MDYKLRMKNLLDVILDYKVRMKNLVDDILDYKLRMKNLLEEGERFDYFRFFYQIIG